MIRTPRTPEVAHLLSLAWRCLMPHTRKGWVRLWHEKRDWTQATEGDWPQIQYREGWLDPISLVLRETDLDRLSGGVNWTIWCGSWCGSQGQGISFIRLLRAQFHNRMEILPCLLRFHLGFPPRRKTPRDLKMAMAGEVAVEVLRRKMLQEMA